MGTKDVEVDERGSVWGGVWRSVARGWVKGRKGRR